MRPEAETVPPPTLREIQERFLAELRRTEAAAESEETSAASEAPPAPGVFLEPPNGSAAGRWAIYRRAYRIRLAEAIRNDYEAVARIVGLDPFQGLVDRYLALHPPGSHDIGRAGDRLPAFLATDPLREQLPFLPDLARFEAAFAASLIAADPEPVDPSVLAALDPFDLLDLPLKLASGAALLVSEWPLLDLWALRDKSDGEVSLELYGRPSRLALHREGLQVRVRELEADEAELLRQVEAGTTLAGLLESGAFGPDDEAAPRVVALFLRLIGSSILRFPLSAVPSGSART